MADDTDVRDEIVDVAGGAQAIEKLFGGKDGETSPKPEEPEYKPEKPSVEGDDATPHYSVVVDGKAYEVTENELKSGFMMQADYTRKTQDLAAARGQLAEEQQYFDQLRGEQEQYLQHHTVIQALTSKIGAMDQLDWKRLKEEDEMEYIKQKDSYRDYVDARNNAYVALEHAKAASSQQFQQSIAKALDEGGRILQRDIPGWGKELQGKLVDFGMKNGLEKVELDSIYDPRYVKLLHKAYLYDQLQGKKVEIPQQARNAPPKVVRSGARVDESEQRAVDKEVGLKRLRRTGRVEDAARLLEDLLK